MTESEFDLKQRAKEMLSYDARRDALYRAALHKPQNEGDDTPEKTVARARVYERYLLGDDDSES